MKKILFVIGLLISVAAFSQQPYYKYGYYSWPKIELRGASGYNSNLGYSGLSSNDLITKHIVDSLISALVYDTTTLASFGGGGAESTDTAAFTTNTIYGSFYNAGNDTLIVTSMTGVLQGTSPSVAYKIYYNSSLSTSGASALVTAGTTLTNTTTGATVSSFDNTKIPPGKWVFCMTPTLTTKPTYMSISVIGYKKHN